MPGLLLLISDELEQIDFFYLLQLQHRLLQNFDKQDIKNKCKMYGIYYIVYTCCHHLLIKLAANAPRGVFRN